jgi:hypothetical protein
MKPNINWVEEVHPQLSNNGHPVDGVLVGAGVLVHCGHKCPNKHKTNIKNVAHWSGYVGMWTVATWGRSYLF